jgi:cysteine desulfurase family protein
MSINLDNAATSHPKPESVYRAVEYAIREIGASPGRGGYRRGLEATHILFETREALAGLFGIRDSSRIAFTSSATEGLNMAILGLLWSGGHVITSSMEHNSVTRPLHLAQKRGAEITRIPCDRRGLLNPRDVAAALRRDTRLIVLSHCSNVTGTIQPVGEIGLLAKKAGVPFLVDAAQSAGLLPIDVEDLGIGLLVCPGHKGLLGPQGTGFLYVAEGINLLPILAGGTGSHSSDEEQPAEMPDRFESGTPNVPGIAGLRAGAEFIIQTGIEVIREKERTLVAQVMEGLARIPGVTLYGPLPSHERGGIVSFTVQGLDPSFIGFTLDREYGIDVRVGLHCSPDSHRTIGTFPVGTVRVSPGWFTTEDEIETFLRAMEVIVRQKG